MTIGFSINFYPVFFENGELIQEIKTDSDVLFLMDYFGYMSQTPDVGNFNGIVIRDVTHSIMSSEYSDADYYFGSLRKWCGVWTGGYARTRDGHMLETSTLDKNDYDDYITLRRKAMEQKKQYIEEGNGGKEYLEVYDAAEDHLETMGIAPATERDITLAQNLDVEKISYRRRANAEVLRSAFSDWLIFPTLRSIDTPMFVPVLVPDGKRDALRRYLINNEIYCPIHWPVSDYHKLNETEQFLYDNELSLVCDQRYTEEDMYRMVETIRMFMED